MERLEQAQTIIVGAGIVGACVAEALAGRGELLVIEQGAAPGEEATAQNAGMCRRLVVDPHERALACRSAALLERWEAEGAFPDGAPLRRVGAVIGAVAPGARADGLQAAAEDLARRGVAVEALAPDRVGERAPALAGAPLHRAWWLPDEGLLDPHAITRAALARARSRGARLAVARRGLSLVVQEGRVIGVKTERGWIEAERVILASGAWSAWLAASAGLARPLVPLARHLLLSAPHPLADPHHPYAWLDDAGLYVRPEAGAWLLSPCDETAVAPPEGPGSRGGVDPGARACAMDKVERLLPALRDLRLRSGWTGLRTFAPDRRPVLGEDPERPGLVWATGLGGAGVTCGLAVGEAVAALLAGEGAQGLEAFSPARLWGEDLLPAGARDVLPLA